MKINKAALVFTFIIFKTSILLTSLKEIIVSTFSINPLILKSDRITSLNILYSNQSQNFNIIKRPKILFTKRAGGNYYGVKQPFVRNKSLLKLFQLLAHYSNLGYCDLSKNDVGGVVARYGIVADIIQPNGQEILIAYFKGNTFDKSKWNERQIKFEKTELHSSFVDLEWNGHVKKMLPYLYKKLKTFFDRFDFTNIWFTGHGIGGVYATIAAAYFQKSDLLVEYPRFRYKINVITFGAPRFAAPSFANYAKMSLQIRRSGVWRVTHTNDWVPREFMQRPSFVHTEMEIWLSHPENDCDCMQTTEQDEMGKVLVPYQCYNMKDGDENAVRKINFYN
ncbi:hypothetical protein G9A89_020238 [Geosiphon pyriformis]|nr:hypothetical protein G9A89_020238 [Geosiphon pyriformis]